MIRRLVALFIFFILFLYLLYILYKSSDKLKSIEEYYKQEIDYLKNELFRKEKDFDQLKFKYDESV